MLTNEQKIELFKRNSAENYRASLLLEGLSVKIGKKQKKVAELKAKYAR